MIMLIQEGVEKIQHPFKLKPFSKLVMERTSESDKEFCVRLLLK